jgi:DNA uptake protein ComE-like DNA-binding protein
LLIASLPLTAEDGMVRMQSPFIAILLALPLAWAGHAQYQDRDFSGAPATSSSAPAPEARIDINHSSVDELMKVPGMKKSWAGRIVRFRPYRTKQDLLDRGIVTSEIYDRLKDFIIAHRDKQ